MATITDSDGWVPVTRPEITDIALGGNETSFPGKFFRELASRDQYLYETALGGDASSIASAVAFRKLGTAAVAQGRLTLEAGVPVSTTDQTAKTILYYTPYKGDYVALYDNVNTRWDLYQFTERSLSLSGLAADTNYDVFIYDNSGILTLEAVAWSNSGAGTSTRASAISQLEGVWVKNSDNRRLLGTIRTTSTTGECEDSTFRRFVWNSQNRTLRNLFKAESTVSWVYTTNVFRPYNNSTANRISLVAGLPSVAAVRLSVGIYMSGGVYSQTASIAIGLNSTTPVQVGQSFGDFNNQGTSIINIQLEASIQDQLTAGYHFFQALERGQSATTCIFEGTNGGIQCGISGTVET